MVDKEDKSSGLDHPEMSKIQDELIPYSFQLHRIHTQKNIPLSLATREEHTVF